MNQVNFSDEIIGYQCIKCKREYPLEDMYEGCPRCKSNGKPSSVKPIYQGFFNGENWLPFQMAVSLGEGSTPLLDVATNHGNFYIKNEASNPTGSHKDRMSSFTISMAIANGYRGVVAASSGNAGLSLASYASYANIPCVIISTDNLNEQLASYIKSTGAELVLTKTSLERWELTKEYVKDGFLSATNYIDPPVGSQPIGIQAYKLVARECYGQLGSNPNALVIPTSRGDLIWGIYEGFSELKQAKFIEKIPKLFAVEPFERISKVLDGEKYTNHFNQNTNLKSIAGATVTWQSLQAVIESNGYAINVTEEEALDAQALMGRTGIHLELSSSTAIAAIKQIRKDKLVEGNDSIIAVTTSSRFTPI
ncbi:pyridoxal-phosphate dependent enzyme [Lentibacillus sp. CBA3610]|uniref:pyridoxal-phosphate dependent enzyme n=1 Tax=Lentibacillus sp. CBA3610 TaxID=2518176 RepID=UPI001595CBD7|nr:pyridoxal-phosphate dependent enzyme [Lentibacillus sp. CBA3610]QKY69386.1 pyridoxal-phosphate dependent enzyme [Lentibacillus sp. CBA3610]